MTESENPLELTYTFSPKETEILAKYIRKNTVPDELGKFSIERIALTTILLQWLAMTLLSRVVLKLR